MMQVFSGISSGIQHAMKNPFGLDFEVRKKGIYVPLGNTLNLIGYNDYLERVVGVVRIALALIALATSQNRREKVIAVGHIARGILELNGNFERHLLILDTIFTLYNIGARLLKSKSQKPQQVVMVSG